MSVPKSVVKLNKKGVTYTSSVDKCNYYLFELSRAALRDVGRFCGRKFRESYYRHFKRRTGQGPKAFYYKVYSNEKTMFPRVDMGLPHATKRNSVDGFYSFFQEFGSSKCPKLGLLSSAVEGNIAEIIKIESQYLSALENEASALALIHEEEMEGDMDGNE